MAGDSVGAVVKVILLFAVPKVPVTLSVEPAPEDRLAQVKALFFAPAAVSTFKVEAPELSVSAPVETSQDPVAPLTL